MGKLNKTTKSSLITYAMVIAVYIIVEIFLQTGNMSSLMKGLLVPICVYVIMAVSLNLTVGILGELSLGHAGFMCIGAFTGAFLTHTLATAVPNIVVRFIIALVVGAVVAGIFGLLIGIPVLRLKGDYLAIVTLAFGYLAIVTLAFGEIVKNIINVLYVGRDSKGFHFSMKDSLSLNLEETGDLIINGAQGITGTSVLSSFTVGMILVLITLFVVINLVNSRTGRAVMAIRDNEIAAESVGINITKYKLLAFSISAALAGVAGVLYAHNLTTLTALPKNFGYNMSITILVFVVLGGIGNIRGSVISAVVLTMLPEVLRGLNAYRMLIYAVILIAMMLFNASPKTREFRERLIQNFSKRKVNKNKEAA